MNSYVFLKLPIIINLPYFLQPFVDENKVARDGITKDEREFKMLIWNIQEDEGS